MSGSTDLARCPRCGADDALQTSTDWKPHDLISGICSECGYEYWTETGLATLEAVNEHRAELDLPPLTELAKPLPAWVQYGYEPKASSPFSKEELLTLAEIANYALTEGGISDSVADKLDLSDEEMIRLQKKLNRYLTS